MKNGRLYGYYRSSLDQHQSPLTLGTYGDIKEVGISLDDGMRLLAGKGWGAIADADTVHWESDERKPQERGKQS